MPRVSIVAAALLFANASVVTRGTSADVAKPLIVESTDSGKVAVMSVQTTGRLFSGLGPARDHRGRVVGRVELGSNGGSATTPAALAVSDRIGSVVFTAPAAGPAIAVRLPGSTREIRGHVLRVVRDQKGGEVRVVRVK